MKLNTGRYFGSGAGTSRSGNPDYGCGNTTGSGSGLDSGFGDSHEFRYGEKTDGDGDGDDCGCGYGDACGNGADEGYDGKKEGSPR